MKLCYKPFLLSLLLVASQCITTAHAQTEAEEEEEPSMATHNGSDDDQYVLRWTSTGGGWRAMFACMGFGNLFQQAGLMDDDHSHFSAISTNSGASWFSTQAFYSTAFYKNTVMAETPTDVKYFAEKWMIAYLSIANEFTEYDICDITDLLGGPNATTPAEPSPVLTTFAEFCNMLLDYGGDWTAFIDEMMASAALVYGDETFPGRVANSGNRIRPLRGTDLLVQSALLANSRVRAETNTSDDTTVNIGNSADDFYTLTLSAAYTVNATFTGFQYNTMDTEIQGNNVVMTTTQSTSPDHSFRDFQNYNLYPPAEDAPVQFASDITDTMSDQMNEPFGGRDSTNVVQVAAVSSAAVGSFSPAGPSTFSQSLSKMRAAFDDDLVARTIFDAAANRLYQTKLLDGFAVCTQWPNECGDNDGLLIDGGLVDNSALPINIAQYHLSGGDMDKTLKIVLTNTNEEGSWGTDRMNTQLLQYFNSSINQGIAPGEFIWFEALPLPFRSPQIFEQSMDNETLNELLEPIEGSAMTTAILNVTTIDNPAFGIRAGQSVEILLINLNAPITTFIVGKTIIEDMITPVANMVHDIAANEELLGRVKEFFGYPPTQATSTETPPPASEDSVEEGESTSGTSGTTVANDNGGGGLQSTSGAAPTAGGTLGLAMMAAATAMAAQTLLSL